MVYVPDYYEFLCPVKILSGNKALSNLPHEMEQLSRSKALVVTDEGVVGAGLLQEVERAFEGSLCLIQCVYDRTPPDSSDVVICEIVGLYRETGCDCVVAVGGGSCIDTAKCVALTVAEDAEDLADVQGLDRLEKDMEPLIAVPTTAGTGSEVTTVAIIAHQGEGRKITFVSHRLLPNVAILDPEMTVTMPSHITAATGMDALTHAIEAFYSLQRNPVSDAFAASAIRLIMANLIQAVSFPEDRMARLRMANAALLAGISFTNALCAIVHGLAHGTGSVARVPHGVANNIFLPFGMEYNLDKSADAIAELAPLLGAVPTGEAREDGVLALAQVRSLSRKLNDLTGLPLTLEEAGVAEEDLPAIAKAALNDGAMAMNPEEITLESILNILKKAY